MIEEMEKEKEIAPLKCYLIFHGPADNMDYTRVHCQFAEVQHDGFLNLLDVEGNTMGCFKEWNYFYQNICQPDFESE